MPSRDSTIPAVLPRDIPVISGVEFEFSGIGTVHLTIRRNTRSTSMRWREGKLYMVVPPGVDSAYVRDVLERYRPRLVSRRPTVTFRDDETLHFFGLTVTITRQRLRPDHILATLKGREGVISLGSSIDITSDTTVRAISNYICRMAMRVAPDTLIPHGRTLASSLGLSPAGWEINRGHRKLGHCTSRGVISLSYALIFLPTELRDYVIYHELAHLTEMNHGPRFHRLCDQYCNGHEHTLATRLRTHPWPLLL
ncbi:MAG: M48 family metallopeptidase [Pseudoflavonifractor sp.]|nr:M48 family metallopeptidase [Pseudoflavonifractor sp.]